VRVGVFDALEASSKVGEMVQRVIACCNAVATKRKNVRKVKKTSKK
jgi:hypothetical protein